MAELVAATSLHHQRLVRYFHVGTTFLLETRFVFIVMELAECSLRDELARTRLSASDVIRLAEHLAESLAFLHSTHLSEPTAATWSSVCVHRDLKPANILRVDGTWKLADLVISCINLRTFVWGRTGRRRPSSIRTGRPFGCMLRQSRQWPCEPDPAT